MKQIYEGAGEDFTPGKYTIKTHMYPADLDATENNQYGGHRVMFYINVQGAGKIAKNEVTNVTTIDMPESRFAEFSGSRALRTDKIKTTTVLAGMSDSKVGTGAVLAQSKPKRRLATAICLYVPESLIKSYNVNWSQEDSESMLEQSLASQTLSASGLGGMFSTGTKGGLSMGMRNAAKENAFAQKAAGMGPGNSKAEMLFSSVDFGSFTFDYRFAPRSEAEAANVLNIVRTFRHHMLPEFFDDTGFLYIYPSEFDIRYYVNAKENEFLERHVTSVLKNMTINYTSQGQMTTFDNGMPTHINMTLQFQELVMPSKETSPADKPGA